MSTFMLSRVLILRFQSVLRSPGKLDGKYETEGKCYLKFSRNPHPPHQMFHFQGLHLDSNTTSRSVYQKCHFSGLNLDLNITNRLGNHERVSY
jgi:hypothetical protein